MTNRTPAARTNEALVLSGLVEVAAGALSGWPYALALTDPEKVRKLGINSPPRLRQWHLDLIALGSLSVLVGSAVPDLPRHVAWPLAVGAWTNANAFGVLAVRPDLKDHPTYRTAVVGSFATVTWACTALTALAARRRFSDQALTSTPSARRRRDRRRPLKRRAA
jgi:hypothetical protein